MSRFWTKLTWADWTVVGAFAVSVLIVMNLAIMSCSRYDSDKETDPDCNWSAQHQSYWCDEEEDSDEE
jgi:hypothetical protein